MKELMLMTFAFILLGMNPSMASKEGNGRDLSFKGSCQGAERSASISFVGDILIHDALYMNVQRGSQNFSAIWNRTDALIQKADFSVGNLEGPAALGIDRKGRDRGDVGFTYDREVYSGTNFLFNFHPRILGDLKNSGYDLLSSANNHALDRSSLGINRTIEAAEKVGISLVGTRHSQDRSADYFRVADINGIKVAFISCTEATNGLPDKQDQVLYCYKHSSQIVNLIDQLKTHFKVDAIIILPHWGTEYAPSPNRQQSLHAKKFLEAGAIAVVGSHPHVLQPWEKYITSDGRETLVIYSLGNFVAFQSGLSKKISAVAYLGLIKRGEKTEISGTAYTPTYRDGYTTFPIGQKQRSKEMTQLLDENFGTIARIEPTDSIQKTLCR